MPSLRNVGDMLRERLKECALVLGAAVDGKVFLVAIHTGGASPGLRRTNFASDRPGCWKAAEAAIRRWLRPVARPPKSWTRQSPEQGRCCKAS